MSSNKARRKICVVVNSRANYGRIKSVMRAIQDHPNLELQTIVGASALLYRFGHAVDGTSGKDTPGATTTHRIVVGAPRLPHIQQRRAESVAAHRHGRHVCRRVRAGL